MFAFRASRYPCSARTRVHKIQGIPESRAGLAGPSQHLRQPAVVVDGYFFVHDMNNVGYYHNRAWGRKCWSRWNARTPLPSRVFFHKIPEVYDALRVEIHAFSMMSVLVRQRSTISDIVSLESMACSFNELIRSAGSLN